MRSRRASGLALAGALWLALSCSAPPAPPPERPAPEPPSWGWIELALVDRSIPADPLSGRPPRPPTCDLEVRLDDEPVLETKLHPSGNAPPYAVESRFRFRASAGRRVAVIYYSSCRTHEGRLDGLEARIEVTVAGGGVTSVHYDGTRLTASPPSRPITADR